ncbi:MAG TPA: DnaJ domain-containing protein [Alphaproteobacteria bacterium]|nr:DnaJ domain-containing protein [Alphaproteobacteria bacterium]
MVVYLILGVALAVGLYLVAQGALRTHPKQVVRALKIAGTVIFAAGVVLLVVTGRLSWILYLLPALLPWLLRLRAASRMFKAARGPNEGQTSTVETDALVMELDHDTGEMDGEIRAGPFEGKRLSGLDPVLLVDFYQWCCQHDQQAARLLEAYLDRTLGAEWREQAEAGPSGAGQSGGRQEAPPGPGGMTREEAYSILGLEAGASPDEIRAAHRRLMQHAHPDRGGSAYLAAKINAAKDILLEQR